MKNGILIGVGAWEMVLYPDGMKTIGCMWINNQKSWSRQIADLYTAWLDAKGFSQWYELDLDMTYGSLHIQIGVTANKRWKSK